jgi:hypothetical protein
LEEIMIGREVIDTVKATRDYLTVVGGSANAVELINLVGGNAVPQVAPATAPTPSRKSRTRPARPARAAKPKEAKATTEAPKAEKTEKAESGEKRHRSSPEEVQQQKDLALNTARTLPPGFSKSDVMNASKSTADLGRALALLVDDGKLRKEGDRRNTRYWVR